MANEINLEVSPVIRDGFFALKRDGHVVEHGRMPRLSKLYQPGDIVLIRADTAKGLAAHMAQANGQDGLRSSSTQVRDVA